jgi:O-antigen ligase
MAAILLLTLLTTLPLPPLLDPLIGGLRANQNHNATILLREAARLGFFDPGDPWFSLTRNKAGTLRMVLLLAAVFGTALCASALPRQSRKAHLVFLAWVGAIIALGGYIGQWVIPQGNTLWWTLEVPASLPGPVGCFINRNHFGGFVAILCPVALALTDDAFRRRKWLTGAVMTLLAATMMFALLHSLSRGSIVAFLAGSGLTALWIVFRRSLTAGILCLVVASVVAGTVYMKNPQLQTRLAELRHPFESGSGQTRILEWRESLRTALHYPLIGAGANGLRMVYPLHRTTSGKWLVNAENEYVQLLAEGGLVGLLLAGTLAIATLRRITRSHDPDARILRVAVIGAVVTAAVHCAFDFPAHLPLYAVVLASLVGLLFDPPDTRELARTRLFRLAPACIGVTAAALLALGPLSSLQRLDSYDLLGESSPPDLQRAIVWAPTSWHAWYMSGRTACEQGLAANRLDLCVFGETLMSHAGRCDPMNYRLWYDIGQTRLALKQYTEADAAFAHARALRPWLHPPTRRRNP